MTSEIAYLVIHVTRSEIVCSEIYLFQKTCSEISHSESNIKKNTSGKCILD